MNEPATIRSAASSLGPGESEHEDEDAETDHDRDEALGHRADPAELEPPWSPLSWSHSR